MQTYLYLHKEHTGIPQDQYRGRYLLKHVDYELSRTTGRKGEITSGVCGGEIHVAIEGFADAPLLAWIFDAFRKENGAIVTLDEQERTVAKLHFSDASVRSYRMNYDSRIKKGVATILLIEAGEMATDSDLYFKNK